MSEKIIVRARLHYPHVFSPKKIRSTDGSTFEKYEATLLIPKSDTATIEKIKQSMQEEALEEHTGMIQRMKDAKVAPDGALRDGDEPNSVGKVNPDYKGCMILSASTSFAPDLLSPDSSEATEEEHLYPGSYVRARISPYGIESSDEPGLKMRFNLLILQHCKDLPRFDMAPDAASIMGVYNDEEDDFDAEAFFGAKED